jgi:hypothetical protein
LLELLSLRASGAGFAPGADKNALALPRSMEIFSASTAFEAGLWVAA